MHNYLRWSGFLALCWWLLLFPKQYHLFSWLNESVQHAVFPFVNHLFGTHPFFEDSSGMYLLLPVSALLGLLTGLIAFIPVIRRSPFRPLVAARTVMLYFLLLELWEYGWIKLVKMQFYLPEPNTVYTPLGQLTKDIAYWSVIGSSRTYVVFLGVTELIAGALLLIRRTRFPGLLLTAGIFVNVLMVNIAFDISVKLFALTLLAMTVALLCGYPNQWRYLLQLPVRPGVSVPQTDSGWQRWGRVFVLSLIVIETVYPSVVTGSLNDDTAPRPAFHGAYAIRDHAQWSRLYVHREGYLILENRRQQQLDWKIESEIAGRMQLLDERTGGKSLFYLRTTPAGTEALWQVGAKIDTLKMSRLPYRTLPLFDKSVHCFSDDYH
jgi:hypothetical protein